MDKRKLRALTLSEKTEIIKRISKGVKQKAIALEMGVAKSTISTIWKMKEKFLKADQSKEYCKTRKRITECLYEDVDSAVIKWVRLMRDQNLPLSGPIIKEKAREFAKRLGRDNFIGSDGWLNKFKLRHNIVYRTISGESASVSVKTTFQWKTQQLPRLLEGYLPDDIYNIDETGLFYKCLPNKTLTFKGDKCFGGKNSKERVTCLVGANMTGSHKLKLLIIGKSANPRCFRGKKSLSVDYTSNKKSWMTTEIFENWMIKLDRFFTRQKRKVLLFLDNCPSHPKSIAPKLNSIRLEYFPPNTTANLQPMDMGIIQNLKIHYRKRILKLFLENTSENQQYQVTLLDCVREIANTWATDVTTQTINNCFTKAGFGQQEEWEEEDVIPLLDLKAKLEEEKRDDEQIWGNYIAFSVNTQSINFMDYVNIDQDVIVSEYPTDLEIVEKVRQDNAECESIDDEDESYFTEEIPRPTAKEVMNAFNILEVVIEGKDNVPDFIFNSFFQLRNYLSENHVQKCKQSRITEFFKYSNSV